MATNAVCLKLPEFWEGHAAVWFAQAEAQFALRRITDDATKYYYVVAALGNSTALRVVSLLQNPPQDDKYDTLKTLLLGTFELTASERARRLLALSGLGDAKPSELMDHMLSLLGDHEPCFLFRELFLQQLPGEVRSALAGSDITDSRKLAKEADKFFSVMQHSGPAVHSCASASSPPEGAMVAATQRKKQDLCYYHARFGPKATRCRPPCHFKDSGKGEAGAQLQR